MSRRCCVLLLSLAVGCSCDLSAQAPSPASVCPGTTGLISAIHASSVSIKNDAGTNIFQITAQTKIWRGSDVSLSHLHLHDAVMVWCTVSQTGRLLATDIMADVAKWRGTITAIHPHSLVIVGQGHPEEAPGRVTIFIDSHTTYQDGSPKDLKLGRELEVFGLDLGHNRVRASTIWPQK